MRSVISFKSIATSVVFYSWIIILACGFWNLEYIFYPSVILLMTVLLLRLFSEISPEKTIRVRTLDIVMAIVWITEVMVAIFSQYQPNSFLFLIRLTVVINSYFIFALIASPDHSRLLKLFTGGYGALIGIATFFFFLLFRSTIFEESFTNLAALKHLYAPFGQISNDWSTVLLIFLAFNCFLFLVSAKRSKWRFGVAIIFLVFGLVVSFSRGAYLSVSVFILFTTSLLIFLKLQPFTMAIKNFGLIFLVICCTAIIVWRPFLDTVKSTQTTSQVRSVSGRLSVWTSAWKMIRNHPVCGVGSGNFALYYPAYKDKSIDTAYTTRVNNTFVQVVLEKGAIGLLAYGFLFLCVLFALTRQFRIKTHDVEERIFACVIAGLLLAAGIKEFTFSSLFENDGALSLLFLIIAFLRINSSSLYAVGLTQKYVTIPAVSVLFFFFLATGIKLYTVNKARGYHSLAVSSIYRSEYQESFNKLNEAISFNPQHVLYHIHEAVALEHLSTQDASRPRILSKTNAPDFLPDVTEEKKELIISQYSKALAINPKDDRAHHGLAWMFFSKGMTDKSLAHLQEAVSLEPSEPLYWISLGLITEYTRDTVSADQYFLKAILLSPDITKSILWKNLSGKSSQRISDIQLKARQQLYAQMEGNPILKARYASLLTEPSQADTAIALLESVNNEIPNLNRAWLNLAILYIQKRDAAKAVPCLKRSILLDKNDYLPILVLASYFEKIKRFDEAIIYYRRALEMQINAQSEYDSRTGKTYETPYGFRTFLPVKLWYAVKLQYPMGEICSKLALLYRRTGDMPMSRHYEKLSDWEILNHRDLQQNIK